MNSITVAVTVAKYYLNPKMWAVKDLSVYLSKDKIRRWSVRAPLILYTDHRKAVAYAMKRAQMLEVIYVSDIKDRDWLTTADINRLYLYGQLTY